MNNASFATVIVPPITVHHLDPHTGIPFMPHIAAHAAGALRHAGINTKVMDAFGIDCHQRVKSDDFMFLGQPVPTLVTDMGSETSVAFIYCRTMAEFLVIQWTIRELRKQYPHIKIALVENIQSVTSFSIEKVADEFLKQEYSADVLILGEPEERIAEVFHALREARDVSHIPGLVFIKDGVITKSGKYDQPQQLDNLPMPAWDLFDLKGYWAAGFAHAPDEREKFLPILTSRGCPYKCTFCIIPTLNPKWRFRGAKHVVDEMEYMHQNLGITDFHVSDLNPTVQDKRTREIASEIIARGLKIKWKLAQGTKIETIKSTETLDLLCQSGLTFLAFSPESGSKRMMKEVNKPFDQEHALDLAKHMNKLGIFTQACFISGLPGETADDRRDTIAYVKKLAKAGVDEVACYIFTPVPGAKLFESMEGYTNFSQCTPSPNWRKDYDRAFAFRMKVYMTFFSLKAIYHPIKTFKSLVRVFRGRYKTKMEMSLFKQFKLYVLSFTSMYKPLAYQKDSK